MARPLAWISCNRENRLKGTHGDFTARDLVGTIDGNTVSFDTSLAEFHGDNLSFSFSGHVTGDSMAGSIDMGEYLTATWTARRHG